MKIQSRWPAALLILFAWNGSIGMGQEWALVWSDEFDQPGPPDPAKWSYERSFLRNKEAQYYTQRPENVRVEDGMLVIEARRERFPNARFLPASSDWRRQREFAEYTSASLQTKSTATWKYGRIEVRAKLPCGRGTWPAIWMLGTNINEVGWPACGEIDIMEHVGFQPGRIHANIHGAAYNHVKGTNKGAHLDRKDVCDEFHTYRLDWFSDRLDFFFDDEKYFSFAKESDDPSVWPYHQRHFLILNLAIGGSWGGTEGIDESIFPIKYVIDYVRVYQQR